MFSSSPKIGPGMEIGGRSIARNPRDSGSSVDNGCAMADHAAPSIGTTGIVLCGGVIGLVLCGGVMGRLGRGRTICFVLSGGVLGDVPRLLRQRKATNAEKTKTTIVRIRIALGDGRDLLVPDMRRTVVDSRSLSSLVSSLLCICNGSYFRTLTGRSGVLSLVCILQSEVPHVWQQVIVMHLPPPLKVKRPKERWRLF